ncbi:MAG: chemotaxis response regulator protein-glutamate methylesterase [Phycisphaerales bacterium]|nr:chemotaxis response regulator protein-glutamate methylesterase [Phycisphaerales bacterium]
MIRVVCVDDSAFMRKAISGMLEKEPGIAVVATGKNGREAIELVKIHRPDVLTLDIEMPEMDGLTALRRIMAECPTSVLMLSSLTTEGSRAAIMALDLGAADCLAKDQSQLSLSIGNLRDELVSRVRAIASGGRRGRFHDTVSLPGTPVFRPGQFDMICIGSSTGGPPVLETVLTALPPGFPIPVVVAQHMPEVFTRSMAERLDEMCNVPVVHLSDGAPIEAGKVHIAPGGKNAHLRRAGPRRWTVACNRDPAGTLYFPSVDVLLASAATEVGGRTLAVVATGMGEDGVKGAAKLVAAGGTILAQSEETCVVFGMPKAVTQAALSIASLSPKQIGEALRSVAPGAGAGPIPARRAG